MKKIFIILFLMLFTISNNAQTLELSRVSEEDIATCKLVLESLSDYELAKLVEFAENQHLILKKEKASCENLLFKLILLDLGVLVALYFFMIGHTIWTLCGPKNYQRQFEMGRLS